MTSETKTHSTGSINSESEQDTLQKENLEILGEENLDSNIYTKISDEILEYLKPLLKDQPKIYEESGEFIKEKIEQIQKDNETKNDLILKKYLQNKKDHKKQIKSYDELIQRRMSSVEKVKETRDRLILDNLKLKKQLKAFKTQKSNQDQDSDDPQSKNGQGSKTLPIHQWMNHINLESLQNNITQFNKKELTNKIFQFQKLYTIEYLKSKQLLVSSIGSNESDLEINLSINKKFGGSENNPTPLQFITYAIAAQFTQTFVALCSLERIKLKMVYIEAILHVNGMKYLGADMTEPLISMIKLNLSVKSNEHSKRIEKIFQTSKERCPLLNLLNTTNKYELKITKNDERKGKGDDKKNKLNNLNIKTLSKTIHKYKSAKTEGDIFAFVVNGFWDIKNNEGLPQFEGKLSHGKKVKVFTCDWPFSIGGTEQSCLLHDVVMVALGSYILELFILQCTQKKIQLNDLQLTLDSNFDYSSLFVKKGDNDDESGENNNTKITKSFFNIITFSKTKETLLNDILLQVEHIFFTDLFSTNKIPIGYNFKFNDEIEKKILDESKKFKYKIKKKVNLN
ncbi:hydroperoxide reductase [Anaeramoeba flamelloides]|uniref:Hydroperoxide reductase n=1 Tax=Anaeramoeba flamelloides TaxID=1746091 RepID=A0ABQ8X8Y9_9EUKA|nr:hydroperoxide reductase [Anaeramoeba flamelloides]